MGNLRVGAAKACITPPADFFPLTGSVAAPKKMPAGWIRNTPTVEGTYHDLYTRVVVIDNGKTRFLFLNLDSGPAPDDEMKEQISARFGIPVENILGVWTHNHAACIKWSRDPEREIPYRYASTVFAAIDQAITQAIANLRPAKYGYGEGASYINVNRDRQFEDGHWMHGPNYAGPVDRTLAALKFEDMDGRLIAAVVNYACHPNCCMKEVDVDGKIKLSADFPGFASEYAETRFGGDAVVLWTNGSSGDINPVGTNGFLRSYEPDGYSEPIAAPVGYGYLLQKSLGQEHGVDIIRTLESITDLKDSMEILGTTAVLDLPGQRAPEGHNVRIDWAISDNSIRNTFPELLVNNRTPAKDTRCTMIQEGYSHLHMQLALLDGIAWIGASGELYCEIGWKLKENAPVRSAVVVTHTHGDAMLNGGYILSDNAAGHDVFERWSTETYPGGNDGRIVSKMLEMFDRIGGKPEP